MSSINECWSIHNISRCSLSIQLRNVSTVAKSPISSGVKTLMSPVYLFGNSSICFLYSFCNSILPCVIPKFEMCDNSESTRYPTFLSLISPLYNPTIKPCFAASEAHLNNAQVLPVPVLPTIVASSSFLSNPPMIWSISGNPVVTNELLKFSQRFTYSSYLSLAPS